MIILQKKKIKIQVQIILKYSKLLFIMLQFREVCHEKDKHDEKKAKKNKVA